MAATRLIALHVNKGKSVAQCLADRTDYSQNAAKTNNGEFISSYEDSIESIGTAVVVHCNCCLYLGKFDHQHFLSCDRSVAPGDCRLLHLLHRKGTVDFPGYPCRYGISGNPYNLSVGMGGCKT